MNDSIMVNVWVYTESLSDFLEGQEDGYLYPLEPQYQTQILVPYYELCFFSEEAGMCRRNQ